VPTVFVLDDSAINARSLSARLRAIGYHVLSMSDEWEAVTILREVRADLLVIDARCAAAGGAGLIREVRRDPAYRGMPVLVVGSDGLADAARLADAVQPGEILHTAPYEIVLDWVRSYLDPLSVPYH